MNIHTGVYGLACLVLVNQALARFKEYDARNWILAVGCLMYGKMSY